MTAVAGASPTAYQTSYKLSCQMLRGALRDQAASRAGVGSVTCRAVAALYALLLEHPIDRRGRCRVCPGLGVVAGRRPRRCRVYRTAHYWLHQHRTELVSSLAHELGVSTPPLRDPKATPSRTGLVITDRAGPDDTDVLPAVVAEGDPDGPRSHRRRSPDQPPAPDRSPMITERVAPCPG